jgi:hypothetical protein
LYAGSIDETDGRIWNSFDVIFENLLLMDVVYEEHQGCREMPAPIRKPDGLQ